MSHDGKQILEATRNFRTYLKNIGQLLSTAGAMMEKHGYKLYGNTACAGGSTQISYPDYWFPQDAFRFLVDRENDQVLVVISVILDDLSNPDSLDQPIVSATWFNYGKAFGNNWSYKLSRVFLSVNEYNLEGKIIDIPPEIMSEFSTSVEILSSQALAVPLVEIQSEHDIEEKIISPLVESLKLNT